MFSATDFFPAYITEFMNFVMMMFPNFGSGSTSRFSAEWRRDIDRVPAYFGRFAPYFERRCLRFLTPWVSRTPRFWGDCCSAGTFLRDFCTVRGVAISWLIVGILAFILQFARNRVWLRK